MLGLGEIEDPQFVDFFGGLKETTRNLHCDTSFLPPRSRGTRADEEMLQSINSPGFVIYLLGLHFNRHISRQIMRNLSHSEHKLNSLVLGMATYCFFNIMQKK